MDNGLNLLVYSKEEYTNQFIMFIRDFLTADTFALFLTLTNEGIATADKIARTAITITNSIKENPLLCEISFFKFF